MNETTRGCPACAYVELSRSCEFLHRRHNHEPVVHTRVGLATSPDRCYYCHGGVPQRAKFFDECRPLCYYYFLFSLFTQTPTGEYSIYFLLNLTLRSGASLWAGLVMIVRQSEDSIELEFSIVLLSEFRHGHRKRVSTIA